MQQLKPQPLANYDIKEAVPVASFNCSSCTWKCHTNVKDPVTGFTMCVW